MRLRISARPALLSWVVLAGVSLAADWPRFRGPNGAGVSADKNVPVQWTAQDVAWKTPMPGVGNSSPIVSKGRVFVHASANDGSSRSLLCLDAGTGKVLWTKLVEASRAHTHVLNSLASSTPAADGEHVFVAFWDGKEVVLHAYDF